jgi:FkbM family methyltransferase
MNRPDVKENLIKAFTKRLLWRLHWGTTNKPYVIPFTTDLKISIPKTGSGSLIYYQGYSELETASFMMRFLKPGMTLVDVGAHIGEYTLIAAQIVGKLGQVHGFEPMPGLFPIVSANVQMNNFANVSLNKMAVTNYTGEIEFEVFDDPSTSSIRKLVSSGKEKLIKVATTSLDEYWSQKNTKIDLIKVDVEGAEKMVFEGAEKLMGLPSTAAPVWLFEYSPHAYSSFGYRASDLFDLLHKHGYSVLQFADNGEIENFDSNRPVNKVINLIAVKDKDTFLNSLSNNKPSQALSFSK